MTTVKDKLLRHLGSMRCVQCRGGLTVVDNALQCLACGRQFPVSDGVPMLLDDQDRDSQERAGHMEALFRFPAFYQLKINVLKRLNTTDDLRIADYLKEKSVLDVGCGPFPYGYDITLPRTIVGIDLSPEFVRAMTAQDPENLFAVANAKKIPFSDKTFDTALLRFVIHHIPGDTAELLREVARVTKGHLIIFDHVRSDVAWQRKIQMSYWNTFDSGHHYNAMGEWDKLLRPYRILAFRRTGKMFGNVCQIIIDLHDATRSVPDRPA